MINAVRASIFYVLVVFAIGFVLGGVRTLYVAPRLGDEGAVIVELPLMIGASYLVCRRLVQPVSPRLGPRALMGGLAFVGLMLLEFGMATALFGRNPAAYANRMTTLAGLLGLAGQLVFAAMPMLLLRARRAEAGKQGPSMGSDPS